MNRFVSVTPHAVDARLVVNQIAQNFEIRRLGAPVALATRDLLMLELEPESRVRAVIKHGRNKFGATRGMTGSTARRLSKRFKSGTVVRILGMAHLARRGGLVLAFGFGVTVVTLDLTMRDSQVELGLLRVIKVLLLERFKRWRVALLALLAAKQVSVVRTDVAS